MQNITINYQKFKKRIQSFCKNTQDYFFIVGSKKKQVYSISIILCIVFCTFCLAKSKDSTSLRDFDHVSQQVTDCLIYEISNFCEDRTTFTSLTGVSDIRYKLLAGVLLAPMKNWASLTKLDRKEVKYVTVKIASTRATVLSF